MKTSGGGKKRRFDNIVSERIVIMRIIEDTGMILIFLYKSGDILY